MFQPGRRKDKKLDDLIVSLKPDELKYVKSVLGDLTQAGESDLLKVLTSLHYERTPVDMRTWLEDPYYMGAVGKDTFPKLKEDLIEMFDREGVFLVIFAGSIGWGKSHVTEIGMLRVIYEISCLRNPAESFGLATGSSIVMTNISIKEALAKQVIFKGLTVKASLSPYFCDEFPYDKGVVTELRFPKNISVMPSTSSSTAVLGLNIISAAVDETNFMYVTERSRSDDPHNKGRRVDHAQTIFDSLLRRIKSRFSEQGELPGKLFVLSSAAYPDSFTQRLMAEYKNDPGVMILNYAQWEPKPSDRFSQRKFMVEVGSLTKGSKILPEGFDKTQAQGQIIEVPEDFRSDFERDLEGSLRDIAGIPTLSIEPYFREFAKVGACFRSLRRHPFEQQVCTMSSHLPMIEDLLVVADPRCRGVVPRYNPNALRWLHIDQSLTVDATGIAMGHVAGFKEVEKIEKGEGVIEELPIIMMDFVLRALPPPDGEIQLQDIRTLIYRLKAMGFQIGGVSADSYQSKASLQLLKSSGIPAYTLSVEGYEQYRRLKDAFYEGRFRCYYYEPLMQELRMLQHSRVTSKPDHSPGGSKDCADATCGVVNGIETFLVQMMSREIDVGVRIFDDHGDSRRF